MTRQRFFPNQVAARPEWFGNFATQLPAVNATLGLPAPQVASIVNDARFCEYLCGAWLKTAREMGPSATATVETAFTGAPGAPMILPVFAPPPLPAGVTAVPGGALDRIFDFVKIVKANAAYTEAFGLQLRIVGHEDTVEHSLPTFALKVERGGGCECVRINFKSYGHVGVVVWSRRANGAWEMLGIDTLTPYLDERPLLDPTKPEVREYRLQFYDDSGPIGGFTEIQTVTVAP